jgi:hypothetical protein
MQSDLTIVEHWRPVTGFEGYYEVSNQGRVRSLDRTIIRGSRWLSQDVCVLKGRILKPQKSAKYVVVGLSMNSVQCSHRIHLLVARAFIPIPLALAGLAVEVNHKDGPSNAASNLEWRTHRGNQQHGAKNELMCGDGVYFSKMRQKYIAQYSPTPNRQKNIGGFDTYEEAKAVRDAAVKSMLEVL